MLNWIKKLFKIIWVIIKSPWVINHKIFFHFGKFLYCFYTNPIKATLNFRGTIIIIISLVEICSLLLARKYITTFTTNHPWSPPLVSMIFAAPVAFFLWKFKNHDKTQELQHQKRELELKEDNDIWDKLVKFQDIIGDKNTTATLKATAIQGLGELYKHKDFKFVKQVHEIFKIYLDDFWNNKLDFYYNGIIPEYIIAIWSVINAQSHKKIDSFFNRNNKLSLFNFNLQHSRLFYINFTNADLRFINLKAALLNGANLLNADLRNADLRGTDFTNTSNLHKAKLTDAKYCNQEGYKTKFPDDFDPEAHEMQLVDCDGNKINNH